MSSSLSSETSVFSAFGMDELPGREIGFLLLPLLLLVSKSAAELLLGTWVRIDRW
jgi:hypothetical protein